MDPGNPAGDYFVFVYNILTACWKFPSTAWFISLNRDMKLLFPEPFDPMRMLSRRRSSLSARIDLNPSTSICSRDILSVCDFTFSESGCASHSDFTTSPTCRPHLAGSTCPTGQLFAFSATCTNFVRWDNYLRHRLPANLILRCVLERRSRFRSSGHLPGAPLHSPFRFSAAPRLRGTNGAHF
jgi:hypothetical protein